MRVELILSGSRIYISTFFTLWILDLALDFACWEKQEWEVFGKPSPLSVVG